MIIGSIDCTLIGKARLKEVTRKNGKIAKFLEICLIETPVSDFGDYMICESVSKEERAKGIKGTILGNAKKLERGGQPASQANKPKQEEFKAGESDVPF